MDFQGGGGGRRDIKKKEKEIMVSKSPQESKHSKIIMFNVKIELKIILLCV